MRLEGLKESARPGHCLVCDRPIPVSSKRKPGTRPRRTCGRKECRREYTNLYCSEVYEIQRRIYLAIRAMRRACDRLERMS